MSRFDTAEIILKECKGHLVSMYDDDAHQSQWNLISFHFFEPRLLTTEG
jgi:hypothetical protein